MSRRRNVDYIVIINEDTQPDSCWYFVPSHPPLHPPETLGLGCGNHNGFTCLWYQWGGVSKKFSLCLSWSTRTLYQASSLC
jgi:hypothetical protein